MFIKKINNNSLGTMAIKVFGNVLQKLVFCAPLIKMETNNYGENIPLYSSNLQNKYYVTNSKVWFPASQNFFQFFYVEFYDDCLEF